MSNILKEFVNDVKIEAIKRMLERVKLTREESPRIWSKR